MSIKKLFLRSGGPLVLLGALYTVGCGGTAITDGPSAGAGGGTAGSGVSVGGEGGKCVGPCPLIGCGSGSTPVVQPGACCATCVPDGQGGTSGESGGSGSVGGCSGVYACPDVACAPGWVSASQPGNCCPVCVPDGSGGVGGSVSCGVTSCPAFDCVVGYKLEQLPGQCCPTCVPDPNACTQGQQGYDALRQKLLQGTGALACKVDSDCTLLAGNAYCGDECSATPVNVTSAPGIDNQLSSYALSNCSTCTPVYPPCAAPLPPACQNAVCVTPIYHGV